jgi:nucleotide-binding universal stress UspA family protein
MRVLLGVDGSSGANAATRWVAAHGPDLDAEVAVAHVVPRIELWGIAALQLDGDSVLESRRSLLQGRWTEPLRAAGLKVSTQLMRGDPATRLCARAEALDAGLLIIGATSHTAVRDLLRGTAQRVVTRSRTPVVLIPAAMASHRTPLEPVSVATSRRGLHSRPDVWTRSAPPRREGIMPGPQRGSA